MELQHTLTTIGSFSAFTGQIRRSAVKARSVAMVDGLCDIDPVDMFAPRSRFCHKFDVNLEEGFDREFKGGDSI
jgi:hypothetical protein